MKTRIGFVSNSSSSSFIYVSQNEFDLASFKKKCKIADICRDNRLTIGNLGALEFGWGWNRYQDFSSKLNWLYLNSLYLDCEEYKENLFAALRKIFGHKLEIIEDLTTSWSDRNEGGSTEGYIDHQSNTDGKELLSNIDDIVKFLANEESYLCTGNDNEDRNYLKLSSEHEDYNGRIRYDDDDYPL